MNYIKILISTYMKLPVLNTIILVLAAVLIWFIWTYRKLKVLALIASLKAEVKNYLKGEQKLNFALEWIIKQDFYKNSLLKFIPLRVIKCIINTVFTANKKVIESK